MAVSSHQKYVVTGIYNASQRPSTYFVEVRGAYYSFELTPDGLAIRIRPEMKFGLEALTSAVLILSGATLTSILSSLKENWGVREDETSLKRAPKVLEPVA